MDDIEISGRKIGPDHPPLVTLRLALTIRVICL